MDVRNILHMILILAALGAVVYFGSRIAGGIAAKV